MKRRALVSVANKTGLVEFCRRLVELEFEIVSTDGTLRALAAAGIPARGVSEVTGVPEILGGRVKTLHPMIFGGILARRHLAGDIDTLHEHGIIPIDLVAVNLYPFAPPPPVEAGATPAKNREADTLDLIDIGGSSLLRAAAKNYRDVYVVVDPADYAGVLEALATIRTADFASLRRRLAAKVFAHTARYDQLIHEFLTQAADEDNGTTAMHEPRR